tara:strand:+ start:3032 stop:3634 length:603 start_codon:yes stop_codon:yes gene_type:complete
MSLRKIKLYGELAKFCGERVLEADVSNAAQAIRFLCVNFEGIEKHMSNQYYKVSADDWDIDKEELHYPTGQSDISIVPVVGGASGKWTKIIVGAALITMAFYTGGATFSMAAGLQTTGFLAQAAVAVGSTLVLSGVSELLTPLPQIPKLELDPKNSFSFNGIQQTHHQGVAIPIQYGWEVLTGSIVISAAIDTVAVEVTT